MAHRPLLAAAVVLAASAVPGAAQAAAPTADFTLPAAAAADTPLTLTATAADPDGRPVYRYDWDLDGDGVFEQEHAGLGPSVTHAFAAAPDDRTVGLRVIDADGEQTVVKRTFRVSHPPTGSYVVTGTIAPGGTVWMEPVDVADPDGDDWTVAYDVDGDGTFETPAARLPALTGFTFPAGREGTFPIAMRITDVNGVASKPFSAAFRVGPGVAPISLFRSVPPPVPPTPTGTAAPALLQATLQPVRSSLTAARVSRTGGTAICHATPGSVCSLRVTAGGRVLAVGLARVGETNLGRATFRRTRAGRTRLAALRGRVVTVSGTVRWGERRTTVSKRVRVR